MLGEIVEKVVLTESATTNQQAYRASAKYTTFHILTDNKKMVNPLINRAYTEVTGMLKCIEIKSK